MIRSMQFGRRNIRSSGRGSGSIEITLPIDLAVLEAVPCGIELRDGLMPEIVLKVDMSFLLPVFETAWHRLALGLERIGDIDGFSESDYVLGLFADRSVGDRPGLSFADGLLTWRSMNAGEVAGVDIENRSLEAFARMFEAMATVAGTRLGLSTPMAALLGNHIAYTATGAPLASLDVFARNSLADVSDEIGWCKKQPLVEEHWIHARPVLKNLFLCVANWDADDRDLTKARDHWYRARRLETRLRSREAH